MIAYTVDFSRPSTLDHWERSIDLEITVAQAGLLTYRYQVVMITITVTKGFSYLRPHNLPRLTLLGRSLLLISLEIAANAVCWIVAGVLFGRRHDTQPVLSLALLAWTIGLRHALDADHISAIDNATRGLISLGQLPVTCGLLFSLGHSTIVIVVNVAIAISSDVYNKIDRVGSVGGIVGAAVSGSFLFIIGLANSIILYRIIKQRNAIKKRRAQRSEDGQDEMAYEDVDHEDKHHSMIMMRILGPVMTFVDRPWKMYPVGVLFGFGFDTASSIALLAVSALAKKGTDGKPIPSGYIVILPLLFTAGMTLIDSLDSIIMLYSYAGFPERSWGIFEWSPEAARADQGDLALPPESSHATASAPPVQQDSDSDFPQIFDSPFISITESARDAPADDPAKSIDSKRDGDGTLVVESEVQRHLRVKRNTMSGLSILLTLMSILVAFSIALITIMGLIGDNCKSCREAAEAVDGGGLAGRWWRGWAKANDNSGYVGAAIVGAFILVVSSWYGSKWALRRQRCVS